MIIHGFELPPLLEANLNSKHARLEQKEVTSLGALLARIERPLPALFDQRQILQVNCLWTSEHLEPYLGTSSETMLPGDIDPQKALIIGEAEPDSPIALDYRTEPPRVIYFGDFEHKTYWLELAPTYEALMRKIRPSARDL